MTVLRPGCVQPSTSLYMPPDRQTPAPELPQSYRRGLLELKIKRILRSPFASKRQPSLILTRDILEVILSILPRQDLLRTLRVNRLFFETGSPLLYASKTGVSYGDEWIWARHRPSWVPRNIFAGVAKPPATSARRSAFADDDPFLPSPLKSKLLATVRHLTWYDHHPEPCDSISLPLFPSLETLTIHQPANGAPIDWGAPLLTSLRPKHVRLVGNYDTVRIWRYPWRLAAFGDTTVEKVTVHFMYCNEWGLRFPPGRSLVGHVEWPWSVRQIDLVFMSPAEMAWSPRQGGRPVYRGLNAPSISIIDISGAALALAQLMASASGTKARVRVIGLGRNFTRFPLPFGDSDSEESHEEEFRSRLVQSYKEELEKAGVRRGLAEERAGQLEMVTLVQHAHEEGTIGF